MRPHRKLLLALLLLTGCRKPYVVPESPLPPNTILLSQMMRQLSAQPGFTNALLSEIDKGGKKGPAIMTPRLIDELRKRILGSDWQGLDRFPGWSMREINPTVRVAGHFAGKDQALEDTAAVHPGTPITAAQTREFLDLGPYALDKAETISLDKPSTLPGFSTVGLITNLGDSVTRGDGPNDLAPEHSDSQRLADILNRLAANKLNDAQPFVVQVTNEPHHSSALQGTGFNPALKGTGFGPVLKGTGFSPVLKGTGFSPYVESQIKPGALAPEELLKALQAIGETVTVDDTRYFANFGHLHFQGKDVMMPFWIDSELTIPHAHGRHLLIPAAHAELEWHIHPAAGAHGPGINADIAYYFGIDGKSEWRTMDTLDQPWVLKRNAHEYTGDQAVEATRLAGLLTVAYLHLHVAHPTLPFGGYYALGVCQDGVSAIEKKLTGSVTLFPNTADASLFNDPRDAEVNAMIRSIPKDRDGDKPTPDRIFGSLPTAPAADPNQAFNAITIPGLAADLNAVWKADHP